MVDWVGFTWVKVTFRGWTILGRAPFNRVHILDDVRFTL
jgi:hypothetical protein